MANPISYDDVVNVFQGCLFVRKGILVKFEEAFMHDDKIKVRLYNLKTERFSNVIFDIEDYKAPPVRIGYVNINGNAVYVSRQPRRLYKAGLHSSNVKITAPAFPHSHETVRKSVSDVNKFNHSSLVDSYNDEYPSFVDALKESDERNSTVAFDKQFAVSYLGRVFYKNNNVGVVVDGSIKFDDGEEYLSTLLDHNYEKTSRNFAPSPL